jgi:glycosyltransferase involved in cell wall biosynthesis
MKIGFDAKRAFKNRSGLGNYSRSVISLLSEYFPENEYILYTPYTRQELFTPFPANRIRTPQNFLSRSFPSIWRSACLNSVIKGDKPDIFHGLSNELPMGISKSNVRSVVTIHDLIFLHHPELYPMFDRQVYKAKFSYACRIADMVLAVSEATRQDIIENYKTDPAKIKVAYQTCSPAFQKKVTESEKLAIKRKYDLPEEFILSVGTIEERKNSLSILKALHTGKIETALVLVGKPTPYLRKIEEYIAQNKMEKQVLLRHSVSSDDLPALYQSAGLFVYPSLFEGFGIPILEALFSGTPVITSKGSCFSETGGDAALYTDPLRTEELADLITRVLGDQILHSSMIAKGLNHANRFTAEHTAKRLIELYQEMIA